MISYVYLWSDEAERGEESGRKDRPVVIVLATTVRRGRTQLLVAPVTHAAPAQSGSAIEIPANVKAQLGLDRNRSWIVVTELNRFIWPGPDLRIVPGRESPFYDMLPDWLFRRVREAVARHVRAGRLKITKRTE
ncbi:MAG TPA: hypothetical protein VMS43_03765 [Allosphingosinicella sp.]|nr:hypothetical protein [Allosphingosinicella sp.]